MFQQPSESLDFIALQQRIFKESGGSIFIGKEQVTPQLRSLLRDEAQYITESRIWGLISEALANEAAALALLESTTWDHVQFAKAEHHVFHVIRNLLAACAKQ